MFWGIVLKPGKKYTQTVKKSFHLSSASLDVTGCGDEPIQLFITTDVKILLCTLRKNKTEQVALDLNFSEEESISFHSQGNGSVHLCGYFLEDEDDFGDFNGLGDEIDDSEDEEVPQLVDSSKPKNKANKDNAKKLQELEKKLAQKGNDDEDEDDDDDEEMDEEDDEDDDDDEEGEEEGEESDDEDDEEEEEDEDEEVEEPKPKQMKIEKPKQNGVDLKNKQEKKKDDKAQDTKKSGGEKSLAGGVKVEDIVTGKGDEAKSGKRVQVYYEGRLKSNNKMFDSTKTGNGFKFKLGQGEVIKGWDVGVSGMKVGGKRRITVPPHMGYGARGSPPVIPPNSTLVFEVELKRVL